MQNGGWWWYDCVKSASPFDHFGINGGIRLVVILVRDLSILRAQKAWFNWSKTVAVLGKYPSVDYIRRPSRHVVRKHEEIWQSICCLLGSITHYCHR